MYWNRYFERLQGPQTFRSSEEIDLFLRELQFSDDTLLNKFKTHDQEHRDPLNEPIKNLLKWKEILLTSRTCSRPNCIYRNKFTIAEYLGQYTCLKHIIRPDHIDIVRCMHSDNNNWSRRVKDDIPLFFVLSTKTAPPMKEAIEKIHLHPLENGYLDFMKSYVTIRLCDDKIYESVSLDKMYKYNPMKTCKRVNYSYNY